MFLDKIALAVAVVGGLNWGSIGLFNFDLVAFISGGSGTWLARIIYTVWRRCGASPCCSGPRTAGPGTPTHNQKNSRRFKAPGIFYLSSARNFPSSTVTTP